MDTYVHIAVGAAVGDAFAQLVDREFFGQTIYTANNSINSKSQALAFVVVSTSGMIAGLLSHLITDIVPHGDYLVNHGIFIPNKYWPVREFIAASFTFLFIGYLTRGRRRLIALFSGLMGGLPDLESLFIGVNIIDKSHALFPVHNGDLPHGSNLGLISFIIEFGALAAAAYWFLRIFLGEKRALKKGGTSHQSFGSMK